MRVRNRRAAICVCAAGLAWPRVNAQVRTDKREGATIAFIGKPVYDSARAAVIILFGFDESFCRTKGAPPDVELQIENTDGKLIGIPVLGPSSNSKGGKSLDGIPLKCGNYTAIWPDSLHRNSPARQQRVRVTLFVNGARTVGYGGQIR